MLETFFLLKNLPPDLIDELKLVCELKTYKPGDLIIQEGDLSTEIYFPVSGQLEYFKYDQEQREEIKFHELNAGSGVSVGEMSFVDNAPRSCSIYASSKSEVVTYVLNFKTLFEKSKCASEIQHAIQQKITAQISNHLRELNNQHIGALKEQVTELKRRNFYGTLFIGIAAIISLTALISEVIGEFFPDYTIGATPTASWIFLTIMVIPAILMIRIYHIPLNLLGVTTKNITQSFYDGIAFTLIFLTLALAILWGVEFVFPETQVFYQFTQLLLNSMSLTTLLLSLHYIPNSYLQEFVSRGMAQTAFQRFFSDRRGYVAVLITSIFFGIGHMPFGLLAVAVTFVGGIALGLIYLRTYNLVGVSIIHYFFGGLLFQAGML